MWRIWYQTPELGNLNESDNTLNGLQSMAYLWYEFVVSVIFWKMYINGIIYLFCSHWKLVKKQVALFIETALSCVTTGNLNWLIYSIIACSFLFIKKLAFSLELRVGAVFVPFLTDWLENKFVEYFPLACSLNHFRLNGSKALVSSEMSF